MAIEYAMLSSGSGVLIQCGREITFADLQHIKEVVGLFPRLSRDELARTLCEHWDWVTASEAYKVQACLKLLEKLEAQGEVRLPEKRPTLKGKERGVRRTHESNPPREKVTGKLTEIGPVSLEIVSSKETKGLWNEYMERYHYLGYKRPFGFHLRYFIVSDRGRLGCVLLAGASKALAARDRWIGWSTEHRMKNLPWVVNNTRLLIFPWVLVKNLASHILGQLARRLQDDWEARRKKRRAAQEALKYRELEMRRKPSSTGS